MPASITSDTRICIRYLAGSASSFLNFSGLRARQSASATSSIESSIPAATTAGNANNEDATTKQADTERVLISPRPPCAALRSPFASAQLEDPYRHGSSLVGHAGVALVHL